MPYSTQIRKTICFTPPIIIIIDVFPSTLIPQCSYLIHETIYWCPLRKNKLHFVSCCLMKLAILSFLLWYWYYYLTSEKGEYFDDDVNKFVRTICIKMNPFVEVLRISGLPEGPWLIDYLQGGSTAWALHTGLALPEKKELWRNSQELELTIWLFLRRFWEYLRIWDWTASAY